MNKTKLRFWTILALVAALALVLSCAIGALFNRKSALAVDYRATELFSAGAGGAVDSPKAEGEETSYVQFTFTGAEGSVYFRRDLALKWYAPVANGSETEPDEEQPSAEDDAEQKAFETKFLSMTFAFPTFDFDRFILEFESAEENVSKEGTSVNSLVFFNESGSLKVAVRNASEQPDKDSEEEDTWFTDENTVKQPLDVAEGEDISFSLSDEGMGSGEFSVTVNGVAVGVFTNIGGYYMEYLSSASSTPRDPITFAVDGFAEGKTEQRLLMKELNGQSFALNANSRVTDNADPALVINEAIYAYTLGRKWSLTYEAIDVCDSSVTITRRYAMVNAANEDGSYPKPVTSEYSALTTSTVFMPTNDKQEETQYVSIYFELDDGTNLSGLSTEEKEAKRIYLWWYAAAGQTATLSSATVYECPECGDQFNQKAYDELEEGWKCPHEGKEDKEDLPEVTKSGLVAKEVDEFTYILVNRGDVDATSGEKSGPYYVGVEVKDSTDEDGNPIKVNAYAEDAVKDTEDADGDGDVEELLYAAEYQKAIDEIAYQNVTNENGTVTKKLKLSAGDGSYFYLPSLRNLISSKNADYRNLRFSVYYRKQPTEVGATASSSTSLRYNALRFEIDEEGAYTFKVLATDAAGNAMKYAVDGQLVTVSSSNIWDIEEIPTFRFEVTYNGATIEDPGSQSLGYRDSTYTVSSFDIVALDGYKAEYKLYRFDRTELKEGQQMPSYTEFVKESKKYVKEYEACLKEIDNYNSEITEDDAESWNRTDNKYHWNPDSSLSFVPQEATIYVVELTVTEESRLPGTNAVAYQVIEVQNPIDPRPDSTYWLENNITSVVLFSVSAVLLIVIIILFVVKPSDKKIEEVDVNTLRGKKSRKDKKDE